MKILEWLTLNQRVKRLEELLLSTPSVEKEIFLPPPESFESDIIRGREVEEEILNSLQDTVEETEYAEEKKWEAQRKQKEEAV